MPMTNAERQAKWRARRNELAVNAETAVKRALEQYLKAVRLVIEELRAEARKNKAMSPAYVAYLADTLARITQEWLNLPPERRKAISKATRSHLISDYERRQKEACR